MSGHSKWSQIKHKKGLADQKRGQLFGKLAKMISVVARNNPDPKTNLRLKTSIEQAQAANMPKENIDRVLKRIADRSEAPLHEVVLEAFGPGGVGMIITAVTDNKNRTIGDVRLMLSRNDAQLVSQGSVMWMFKKEGSGYTPTTTIPISDALKEKLHKLFELIDDNDDVQDIFSNESGE